MYKTVLWIVCLLLVSTGAMAAPRASIRDGSQIGGIKEAVLPVAYKLKHADAISGARQLDLQAYPDKLANDDLAMFSALTQPHGKAALIVSQSTRHTDFGAAPRNKANFAAEEIPAHIKLVLAQPAAPPVVNHQTLAPRQAL
ncbi:MAG: hypothetical protein A2061_06305 [Gallionellales bacterium GWA2_59_43]|nr:MAG: hypothetical protein A2061_06305 [Gallionellales bacterium GWA2_59_43]